jgi:hypothetical protein
MSLPELEELAQSDGYLESRLHVEQSLDRFRRMGNITEVERQRLTNFLTNISVSMFTALSIAMYVEGCLINAEICDG